MRKMREIQIAMAVLLAATFGLGVGFAVAGGGNVDELRFGTAVNAQGVVTKESSTDHFLEHKPIHVTMKVMEAPKGTDLMLVVLNQETDETVWSKDRNVPGGHSDMHFVIANLPAGEYKAKVKLGDDWVAEHEFKVEG